MARATGHAADGKGSVGSRRHRFGVLLLGLGLGCARPNGGFDDTEGTHASGSSGAGPATTGPDGAGTDGSDTGTTGSIPDPDSTDEGSTAPPEPTRVVLFPGPVVGGGFAASSSDPFGTLEDLCHIAHDQTYATLECPNGIWGMIGTEALPLNRYPMLDGGAPLFGVPIYASDLETVIADDFGDLVLGTDIGSLQGTDLVASYWWGRSIPLSNEPTCQDWTSGNGALQGGAVQVTPTPPWFAQVDEACDVYNRALCLCF